MKGRITLVSLALSAAAMAGESFETSPIRPAGGDLVPPPFVALETTSASVRCSGRSYDLAGIVPVPSVAGRSVLRRASVVLNGAPLKPAALRWRLETPAVAIAQREWTQGALRIKLVQTVEYDGFITADLTLDPADGEADLHECSIQLEYYPNAAVLYHIPVFRPTWAGFWPKEMEIEKQIVGVWGGDDHAGFASYVATFRDWRTTGPKVVLKRGPDGAGTVLYRVIARATTLRKPVTYRFGFIATPVTPPEPRHWQAYAFTVGQDREMALSDRMLLWGGLSDYYATFRTNKPDKDQQKLELVREIRSKRKSVLAYTTYSHVEEGVVEVPLEWALSPVKGGIYSRSMGGAQSDRNRVFLCPGSRDWVEWKMRDLRAAVERYGVDGFYVDTSYIILPCANALHGHGWVDDDGQRQWDYPLWSMREIWRRSYEMLCQTRGAAAIYAHHKGGCPAALAAFTSAYCDGEQYTAQSIKHLTLDAFRAQVAGRNMGPLAIFLNEYYRSANYNAQKKAEHHNPKEGLMLALLHDVLAKGYPGLHPVRELIALRDDLGIADAVWQPYYAAHARWHCRRLEGCVVSSYRTARGDTLLVIGNPTYEAATVQLDGPDEAKRGQTFVAIDVFSRLGRGSPQTPGYRWEEADPADVAIEPRSLGLFAFVREPRSLPKFAEQHGFIREAVSPRKQPIPPGALLVSNCDDPDWVLVNDDGRTAITDDHPVDTTQAMRVLPKPQHSAAALIRTYPEPQNWEPYAALTFWVRPSRPLPVRAFQIRLRNKFRYGPALTQTSHDLTAQLPAGHWTPLRYDFRGMPREHVQILRIYYHRGELCSGAFDIDEVILRPAQATQAKTPPGAQLPGAEDGQVPD